MATMSFKELELKADADKLDEALDFVNSELERNNYPADLQSNIDVAVEEVFLNIAHYAYKPESGNVTLGIAVDREIFIKFEDSGKPYNPLDKSEPDLDKPLIEREIGGLGIFLVRKLMDGIHYSRLKDKNVLIISKKM